MIEAILTKAFAHDTSQTVNTFEQHLQAEFDHYKIRYLPEANMDTDPLKWLQVQTKDLPILSTMARKCLSVCGTSVASE